MKAKKHEVSLMSALHQLLRLVETEDPFRNVPADLYELQLAAANERLAQRRRQIRVLDQRATDRGVAGIDSPEDIVPLLFSDATYKSYPESFLDQKRWDRMTQWLQTLTSEPITGIDFSGIQDIDDWLIALARHGHHVMSSSGTSGKNSFLVQNQADMEVAGPLMLQVAKWGSAALREAPPRSYAVFVLGPSAGSYSGSARSRIFAEAIGRLGDIHYISDVPQSAQEATDLARLNRAIANGSAKPSEIQAFQQKSDARRTKIQSDLSHFLDKMMSRRDEPIAILGLSTTLYQLMEMAKARGHTDGRLHPDSHVSVSGGRKGVDVPPDFNEKMVEYFGLTDRIYSNPYGMAEMSGACPILPGRGGWPLPPWIVPLVIERSGETLVNPANGKGIAEGRLAFLDLLVEGRWGGLVTGDKVVIDFSPSDHGVRVPVVRTLDRYKDLPGGDDKATCAGTIDAFVGGALELA
jgi:hypothetical protein